MVILELGNATTRWNVTGRYGFVYKWFDDGRGRYYIGSHWGSFGDGYVCTPAMRDAHRRRPKHFRRRILAVVTTNRNDLLERTIPSK